MRQRVFYGCIGDEGGLFVAVLIQLLTELPFSLLSSLGLFGAIAVGIRRIQREGSDLGRSPPPVVIHRFRDQSLARALRGRTAPRVQNHQGRGTRHGRRSHARNRIAAGLRPQCLSIMVAIRRQKVGIGMNWDKTLVEKKEATH